MRTATVLALVVAWFVSVGGCQSGSNPTQRAQETRPSSAADAREGAPSSETAISAEPTTDPHTSTDTHTQTDGRHAAIPCRAIAVDGEVRYGDDAGLALAQESGVASEGWVALGSGARLVVKDPRSTRETTFRGPARVRACVGALEESWVASGAFESTVGAGESPGAEEWVVTPLGVVRFAAARLSVQVSSHRRMHGSAAAARSPDRAPAREAVRLVVADGVAFVWTARDAMERGADGGVAASPDDEGWVRVAGATSTLASSGLRTPFDAARSAVDVCAAMGKSAHDLASALLAGEGAVGPTAARQVTARRLARAACAVAGLRVDRVPASDAAGADAKAGLEASLREALGLWRGLPHKK